MAVNDLISEISAANATFIFQPAAGVEIIVTSFIAVVTAGDFGLTLTNGTNNAISTFAADNSKYNIKVGITNTLHLLIPAQGANRFGAFTGIQTK